MTSLLNFTTLPTHLAEWLQFLLGVSLKGVIVLLFAAALIRGLRRASASARHLVWSLALGGALALPAFELLMPGWQLPLFVAPPQAAAAASVELGAADETVAGEPLTDAELLAALRAIEAQTPSTLPSLAPSTSEVKTPAAAVSSPEDSTADVSAATTGQTSFDFDPATLPSLPPYKSATFDGGFFSDDSTPTINWGVALLLLWVVGVFVVFGRMLFGTLRVARIARRGRLVTDDSWVSLNLMLSNQLSLKQPVKLIQSSRVAVPLTWGVFRPVVLLPAEADEWTAECRRIVLLHELSHIKRRDCLTQMLAQFACALHWFNPLAWAAARQLRVERELACDDQVLEVGTRATDYAGCLVEIASALKSTAFASPLTVGMACSHLESRVRSILNPDVRRRSLNRTRVTVATFLTIALLAPLSVIEMWGTAAAAQAPETVSKQTVSSEGANAEREALELPRRVAVGDKQGHHTSDETAGLAQTVSLKINEKMTVLSSETPLVTANATSEALLQAIDARVRAASGQSVGQSEGQGKAQGDGKSSNADFERLYRQRGLNITPEYIEAVKRMGFDNLTTNQLAQLYIQNVTEDYVNQVRSWGLDRLTVNSVVQLKVAGVTTAYVNAVKGMGLTKLSLSKLAGMKQHNVTPEFAEEMRAAGYDNLTADQLMSLRVHGINARYIREVESWGYGKLSLNDLMQVKIFNITPAFADEVKAMGFRDVGLKQLLQMRIHRINADFMREMSALGFTDLTLDQLIQMKVHAVTPDYVRRLRAAGYKNISVKQLIDFKVSGVDEILLRNSR